MRLKLAEAALQEKTAYLDSILRSSMDMAIIATDLNLQITYFNPVAESIYEHDPDEAIGKNILDIITQGCEEAGRIQKIIASVKDKRNTQYESKYKALGNQRFLECQISDIRDSDNRLLGYVFISKDITDKRNNEAKLNTYLHYLESIEKINRIICKVKNEKQMMKDIVDSMLAIFGCDRAWLLYPCNPDADHWSVPVEATNPSYPGAFAEQEDIPVDPEIAEAFQMALDSKWPIVYDPTTKRPIPTGDRFSIQSQMLLAIYPRLGDPWLFGMHQCSHARVWSSEEQQLFQDIGHRLSDGISNLLFHQSLNSTQQEWEESLNAVHDHIGICDLSGNMIRTNQAMHKYFEPLYGDLIGLNYRLIYFGSTDCEPTCPCSITLSNGEPVEAEIQFPTMSGWQQVSVYPRFDTDGEQIGAVIVVRDITRSKLNEDELQTSKERYQTLVETMTEGLGVQDKNGTIQYVNGRLCEMLGYEQEDFIGRNISNFVGRSNISDWQEKMQHRWQGNAQPYEAELIHRDGHKVLLNVSPQTIKNASGEFCGSFAVVTDLTERKQTEDRLRKP
ncbi:PAS domain-containing protein [Pseudomonadota bacterium]